MVYMGKEVQLHVWGVTKVYIRIMEAIAYIIVGIISLKI
jgi:hypothetical protein